MSKYKWYLVYIIICCHSLSIISVYRISLEHISGCRESKCYSFEQRHTSIAQETNEMVCHYSQGVEETLHLATDKVRDTKDGRGWRIGMFARHFWNNWRQSEALRALQAFFSCSTK